jgi:hypothetical protein
MKRLAVAVAVTAVMAIIASPATAHPVNPPFVGPHQHILMTPNGSEHRIGPDGCATGGVGAFQNFHYNVHVGSPADAWLTNPVSIRGGMCPQP